MRRALALRSEEMLICLIGRHRIDLDPVEVSTAQQIHQALVGVLILVRDVSWRCRCRC